jgi:hypothetical protein
MKVLTIIVLVVGIMVLITLMTEMTNITLSCNNSSEPKPLKDKKCFKLVNLPKNKPIIDVNNLVDFLEKSPYKHQLIPHRKGTQEFQKDEQDVLLIGKLKTSNKVLIMDLLYNDVDKYKNLLENWITFCNFY